VFTLRKNLKREILKYPTTPLEVSSDERIDGVVKKMLLTGFQGRKLAEAFNVWSKMLKKKDNVIWLGLAGAMVPAGMRRIISYFIKRRMVDVLVSTGANLYHDCFEALGGKHYLGTNLINDIQLRECKIDRIHDVFADEKSFYKLDVWIEKEFCANLEDNYPYSSREILYLLGKKLHEEASEKDSILVSAYRYGVPIFSPALGDSSLGFSIMFANRREKRRIIIDSIKDVHESSQITEKSKWTGVIYIGGGTPKNFIQQTAVIASYQTRHDRSHNLAIQITTDMPVWGGLSGCTLEEAQSWGKISKDADMVTCYSDATIALPIISHALSQRFKRFSRDTPLFEWENGDLTLKFKKMKL
jgi:deoxyhypusine synthase